MTDPTTSPNHTRGDSPSTHRTGADPESTRAFAIHAAQTLRDAKCEDLAVLDVRGLSPVTDYLVIGSGTSARQMNGALSRVKDLARHERRESLGTAADDRSVWLLADFIDVVVHLFEPNARAHYDLEMLWGDATRVPVPDGPGPTVPGRTGKGG
ncbi:MAG: ribosome silencing factor [Phycisphaerales bacterium JB040]